LPTAVRGVARLLPGVLLTMFGFATAMGTFGMLALIGVPMLAVGLGLLTANLPE
jgi:hypothetical protein